MKFPEITERIIVAALKVHSAIGPGVLESVYKTCLAHELKQTGLTVSSEVPLPVVYDGLRLDSGFRIDLLVENLANCGTQVCGSFASHTQSAVADVSTTLEQTHWLALEFQCRTFARWHQTNPEQQVSIRGGHRRIEPL